MSFKNLLVLAIGCAFLSACASSAMKNRKDQQSKLVQSSKLYCQFINGDEFPDIDVAVNLDMAKHCDSEKPFSLSQYKTKSESQGVLYCCGTPSPKALERASEKKSEAKPVDKSADKPSDKKSSDDELE